MSKKRFSEGLDDLFKDASADQAAGEDVRTEQPGRKGAQKNFTFSLDALLHDALEESLEKYESNQPDSTTPSARMKAASAGVFRPGQFTGLDALIRQTI
ncbi:MAG: hypothetical protein ABIO24_07645, partial [Saprospiraceae bacterium]